MVSSQPLDIINEAKDAMTDSGVVRPIVYNLIDARGLTGPQIEACERFAKRLVVRLYPSCDQKRELFRTVLPVTVGGYSISQTKAKFASGLSTSTHIEVLLCY